ncbi:acyloxyacyl hydrolase [Nibricoccus aquaticus]|nr:acyloxyacyl hydrolase [Nibricoccus aquaticus]
MLKRVLVTGVMMAGALFARAEGRALKADTEAAVFEPVTRWEFAYESGALWRVGGGGSQLDYVILPQMLTWKTPEVTRWTVGGRDLVLRSRFSVLLEPFAKGPESHFVGGAAGGLLEWWDARRTQALFFSAGGGVGLMDSKGYDVAGAQGQDFNFNWFTYAGSRWQWSEGMSVVVGVYFQHISNRGQDKVNPGINSVGPIVNVGWGF